MDRSTELKKYPFVGLPDQVWGKARLTRLTAEVQEACSKRSEEIAQDFHSKTKRFDPNWDKLTISPDRAVRSINLRGSSPHTSRQP